MIRVKIKSHVSKEKKIDDFMSAQTGQKHFKTTKTLDHSYLYYQSLNEVYFISLIFFP